MKILERLALIIFSIIILILAVVSCLVVFDLVELEKITEYINEVIQNETVEKVIVISSVVCILLAIKALFFPTRIKKKEEIKSGVLLENRDGRLLISKDTIENLIVSVVKSFKDAMDVQTKVYLDSENNITVFISLLVNENAVIKELSSNIQTKIKETVKRNTDLDVNQININVKNIENNKSDNTVVKAQNSVAKIKLENVQVNKNEEVKLENANVDVKTNSLENYQVINQQEVQDNIQINEQNNNEMIYQMNNQESFQDNNEINNSEVNNSTNNQM